MNKGATLVKDPVFKCILGRRRGPLFCEPTPTHPSQDSFNDLEVLNLVPRTSGCGMCPGLKVQWAAAFCSVLVVSMRKGPDDSDWSMNAKQQDSSYRVHVRQENSRIPQLSTGQTVHALV